MQPVPSYTFMEPEGQLAHYTSASVVFEHILPSAQLRMSPYRAMRDPAENKDLVPGTAGWGDGPGIADYARALDEIKRVRDSMRVLSMTQDAPGGTGQFGCCWARPRMWEQYGDLHRGACLVFHRERLQTILREDWAPRRTAYYLGEVRYTRAGIAESASRTLIDDRILKGEPTDRADALAEYIQRYHKDFFFLKTDDFATEYEYRAVVLAPSDDFAFVQYKDALAAVVVGEHFASWQLAGAAKACDAAGVELRRVYWFGGRPHAVRVKE